MSALVNKFRTPDGRLLSDINTIITKPAIKSIQPVSQSHKDFVKEKADSACAVGTIAIDNATKLITETESTLSSVAAAAAPALSEAKAPVKPDRKLADVSDWLQKSYINSQAKIDKRLPKIEDDELTLQNKQGSGRSA